MPFANYTSIGEVARAYQITLCDEKFVAPLERPVSSALRDELAFAESFAAYNVSESAVCEWLIHPFLKEVWKSYLNDLMLWSHVPLNYDDDLCGTPDYFLARRSPLGRWILEKPYVVVMEAKRDDPERGWSQCLAALLAAQKLNNLPELILYGITTNGRYWEFGKLEDASLTRDPRAFTWTEVETLCGALHFVFEQCRAQLVNLPQSA